MDRLSNQKINKETMVMNDTLHQMDLTDIFRIFHPNVAEYMFFSSAHETFSRINHIMGHKSALKNYKKIKMIPCMCSDHHTMKLKSTTRKNCGKITNSWIGKNILLKNEWANQEVKEEVEKYMEANENDNTTAQNLWDAEKKFVRGNYIPMQTFPKKEERSQIHT